MPLAPAALLALAAVTAWPLPGTDLPSEGPPMTFNVGAVTQYRVGPDKPAVALSIAYAAAVGADIGSSVACSARGTCHEANPLYGSANGWQFGAARAAIGAGTLYVVHRWTKPRTWPRYVALGVLVVGQSAIVAWNVRQNR